VHLDLTKIPSLRAGLYGLFSQNLILMGVFFVIPLYLQLVLGLDALETGIKMLPVSITMFLSSALGSRLSKRFPIRTIVRAGLWVTCGAALVLVATIDPQLKEAGFAVSMGLLGVGMGLMASQLGNVVQSSVEGSGRGEAGGLQYTGQQLGSSLGVALIGAIVLAGLTGAFISQIEDDERIDQEVATEVSTAAGTGVDFVASTEIEDAGQEAGLSESTTEAIVDDYEEAQLVALKAGLLAVALLALASLAFTADLPHELPTPDDLEAEPAPT
jgi:Na+/melibiose symporter-like transporter